MTTHATRYWRHTLRLTVALLLAWFVVVFVATFFARDLGFVVAGWPWAFWFGAQGALLLFLAIVGGYAWAMDRLDRAELEAPAE